MFILDKRIILSPEGIGLAKKESRIALSVSYVVGSAIHCFVEGYVIGARSNVSEQPENDR